MPNEMSEHFSGGTLKTPAKLIILDWYLKEYVNIMEKNWSEYWYVDTHAGTGKTECGNGALIDGSAIRVLNNHADNFDRFYFYELNERHFQTLHRTLSKQFGYDFEVSEAKPDDADFLVARHEEPYIRIMQMDSNEGVSFLAEKARSNAHWFTFVDPKGLTAKKSTLDTLIQRGHMDILINYQTTGVMRNAAKKTEHGHDAVDRTMGENEWPTDGSEQDYVDLYKELLEQNTDWEVNPKNMENPRDDSYRFDLVFASASSVAHEIMGHIMEERDDELWKEASKELGQPGLERWSDA